MSHRRRLIASCTALGLAFGHGLQAKTLTLPALDLQVVDHADGQPLEGIGITLLVERKKTGEEVLATAATDRSGRVRIAPRAVGEPRSIALRFSWAAAGLPERSILYRFRAKKGQRTADGRTLRAGQTDVPFLLPEEGEAGGCENLFRRGDSPTSITLRFERPPSYAKCQETGFGLADPDSIGRRNINAGALNLFSFDRDVELGRDFVNNLGDDQPPLRDRQVVGYVQGIVDRLGRASDLPELSFHVEVIDADIVNAFALPGGYLFVYRGLLERTETEAELVGVLAHEIAHVTGRHGTEGMTSAIGKMVGALAVGALLAEEATEDPRVKELILGAAMAGSQLWILGGTRKREAEADRLGAQYAMRAGWDPRGLAAFFGKLSEGRERRPTRLDVLFSDHPSDQARVATVTRMADYFLPPSEPLVVTSPEYEAVKARLETLPPPKMAGQPAADALFGAFRAANQELIWREFLTHLEGEAGAGG